MSGGFILPKQNLGVSSLFCLCSFQEGAWPSYYLGRSLPMAIT